MDYLFRTIETDLASRKAAAKERIKIAESLSAGSKVHIDLTSALSVAESYSDELLGVLVLKFGLKHVADSIKISTSSKTILLSIAVVMQRREKERLDR